MRPKPVKAAPREAVQGVSGQPLPTAGRPPRRLVRAGPSARRPSVLPKTLRLKARPPPPPPPPRDSTFGHPDDRRALGLLAPGAGLPEYPPTAPTGARDPCAALPGPGGTGPLRRRRAAALRTSEARLIRTGHRAPGPLSGGPGAGRRPSRLPRDPTPWGRGGGVRERAGSNPTSPGRRWKKTCEPTSTTRRRRGTSGGGRHWAPQRDRRPGLVEDSRLRVEA